MIDVLFSELKALHRHKEMERGIAIQEETLDKHKRMEKKLDQSQVSF